jgi:hypothetical protein
MLGGRSGLFLIASRTAISATNAIKLWTAFVADPLTENF